MGCLLQFPVNSYKKCTNYLLVAQLLTGEYLITSGNVFYIPFCTREILSTKKGLRNDRNP